MDGDASPALKLVIAGALGVLYSSGTLDHDLWTPDEPRVASIGRQVAEGAWVVPTLNGEPFLEEPPLHAWCVALVYGAFGFETPSIARAVSAVFGLGGLAGTYLLAAHLAGRRAGLLAALSLGLSLEYFATAHRVVVDGALTFFTTGSAYACLRGLGSAESGRRLAWLALGYMFASLAFLAKGPIGVAVPALAVLAAAFAGRDVRLILRAQPWLAPIVFAAVTGPWLWLLHRELGPDGLRTIFIENFLGRVLPADSGTRSHLRPSWFYFLYLPIHLLPATLFVAGGFLQRYRGRHNLPARERKAYDLSLAWLVAGFAMLTVASTKRPVYLVPFFPAAAITGGLWLDAFIRKSLDGAYERGMKHALGASIALLAAALPVAAALAGGASMPWGVAGAAAVLVAAAACHAMARRDDREALLKTWVFGLAIALLAADFAIVPAIDRKKSLAAASREVARLVPPDRPICAIYADETTRGMVPLYTGRPLTRIASIADLEKRVREEGEVHLLTVDKSERRAPQLEAVRHLSPTVIYEDAREGSRTIRLLLVRG